MGCQSPVSLDSLQKDCKRPVHRRFVSLSVSITKFRGHRTKKGKIFGLAFKYEIDNNLFGNYSSATTGLYLGTRAFMMHQPMR